MKKSTKQNLQIIKHDFKNLLKVFDPISIASVPKKHDKVVEKIKWAIKIGKNFALKEWFYISELFDILNTFRLSVSRQLLFYTVEANEDLFITIRDKNNNIMVNLRKNNINEKLFKEKTQYTSTKEIAGFIESLGKEVFIIDPYTDNSLLDVIALVDNKVKLNILTINTGGETKKISFVGLAKKLLKERGNFEIRESNADFHDRYLITEKASFSIGSSIKDIGEKKSILVPVIDLHIHLKKWSLNKWSNATKLI